MHTWADHVARGLMASHFGGVPARRSGGLIGVVAKVAGYAALATSWRICCTETCFMRDAEA